MDKKHLELLGNIVSNFNELELVIKMQIGQLLDSKDINKGFIVCNELGFQQMLSLWKILFKYQVKDEGALKEFEIIAGNCSEINLKRNRLIHSRYTDGLGDLKSIVRIHTKMGKDLMFQPEMVENKELDEFDKYIFKNIDAIHTLVEYLDEKNIFKSYFKK